MSLSERLFEKFGNKVKLSRKPITQENQSDESNSDENSSGLFLEIIGDIAYQVKENYENTYIKPNADLSDISIDEFPEAEMPESTINKIEELKRIIQTIENKIPNQIEIKLTQNYKINYALELNKAQLEAVTTLSGPVLVIAGAGSGKTSVIVHRVAFMLENGVFPQEILLLTFTRRAATEMLGRVQELLKDNSAQKVFGGTFHSFSNYVLRKYVLIF